MKKPAIGNLITVCALALLLIGGGAWWLLRAPDAVSVSERRPLAGRPKLTAETLMNGEWMDDLEAYSLDQFPLRDAFRTLKARFRLDVFRQKDNNGIFVSNGHVGKQEYPLRERSVIKAADKIDSVTEQYLADTNCRVFAAVIRDKNAAFDGSGCPPRMDYERIEALFSESLDSATYLELGNILTLDDFYTTDPHWRQESLTPVLERLGEGMGFAYVEPELTWHSLSPFYGAYYGQSALPLAPDTLVYGTNAALDACTNTDLEKNTVTPLYQPELIDGMDGYDVFLGGASALQVLENPNGTTGRELVLFRDSFGSSIAPLLLTVYDRVTLVDLRYIHPDHLGAFLTFEDQDVLFLYSTLILNQAEVLR